jgi:nucleoside-diphosphate-sugar epimerase
LTIKSKESKWHHENPGDWSNKRAWASCIDLLIRDGHRVYGLARSAANVAMILKLGAVPFEGDLFNPASVRPAIHGCEAVLHLATKILPANKMKQADAWAENDVIRRDGTRILVDAALENRATTRVYPSSV